jgi:hypothetical protein
LFRQHRSPPKKRQQSSWSILLNATNFSWRFLEILTQKPQILHGYLIRLTREYTDGGMDSRAEEE